MPNTFELISAYTATGSVSQIDFTSIPQTFTDLCIKFSIRTNRANAADSLAFYINNDTTAGRYPARMVYGDGSTAYSYTTNSNWDDQYSYIAGGNATASTFGNGEFYFPNYAGSSSKSVSADSAGETNGTTAYAALGAIRYTQTNAITQITLKPWSAASIVANSTAYLYGVKNS